MNIIDWLRNATGNQMPDREQVKHLLTHVHEGYEKCNEQLRGILGAEAEIDEMALLVINKASVLNLLTHLVSFDGYELFNSASDTVTTSPIHSGYDVHYWFVRTPYNYRLEVMYLPPKGGYSPLHNKLIYSADNDPDNNVYGVHASFKCDSSSYMAAGVLLRKEGWELAQRCDSDYGKFSYYANEDNTGVGWFLKPRVNLRDAAKTDE
jgi:hypothetical protein